MTSLEVQPPALLVLAQAASVFAREVAEPPAVPAVGGVVQAALTELVGAWDRADTRLGEAAAQHGGSLVAAAWSYARLEQVLVQGRLR